MPNRSDWLPSTRAKQLEMAHNWVNRMSAKKTAWNIPDPLLISFMGLINSAEAALEVSTNEASRTPVTNAQCREAFKQLDDSMRDTKKRYFLQPPLLDSDIIGLELHVKDTHPTHYGAPTAQVTLETFLLGRHELGFKIVYVTGSPDDPANKGYRVWYKIVAAGEAAPTGPDQLTQSFFTKRKKDVIPFGFDDSGKMVYLCVQIENDGKKGPWGPMVSALIP